MVIHNCEGAQKRVPTNTASNARTIHQRERHALGIHGFQIIQCDVLGGADAPGDAGEVGGGERGVSVGPVHASQATVLRADHDIVFCAGVQMT
tara:strand:+ start:6156 stop:6434 length:279 start_codon:yes stop_codon:yes gene_type:complete